MTTTTALEISPPAARPMTLVRPIAPVNDLVAQRAELTNVIPRVLQHGVDIIKIPGTDKDCLSKAGAERVAIIFGCHPEYDVVEKEVDHDRIFSTKTDWVETDEKPNKIDAERLKAQKKGKWKKNAAGEFVWCVPGVGVVETQGLYRYVIRCRIVRQDGLFVGDGIGCCSTLEAKYASRPRDVENTVLKMAQKRAFVGAVLNAFGLSDRFTGDLDENDERDVTPPVVDDNETKAKAEAAKAEAAKAAQSATIDAVEDLAEDIITAADSERLAALHDRIGDVAAKVGPRHEAGVKARLISLSEKVAAKFSDGTWTPPDNDVREGVLKLERRVEERQLKRKQQQQAA